MTAETPSIDTIVYPHDLTELGGAALERAREIAERLDAQLVVTHIVLPLPHPSLYGLARKAVAEHAWRTARERLDQIVKDVTSAGLRCRSYLDEGDVSSRIAEIAEELDAGLLVVATRGRTGLGRMLLGSTAERIVRRSPCPVLTIKAAVDPDP